MKKFRGEFSDREMAKGDICGGTVWENFPGDFLHGNVQRECTGQTVWDRCPDAHAGLQVSTSGGCNLGTHTHTHTQRVLKSIQWTLTLSFCCMVCTVKNTDNSEQYLTELMTFF